MLFTDHEPIVFLSGQTKGYEVGICCFYALKG